MNSIREKNTDPLVVGLDSSTTATKAIACNKKGDVIALAHEPIPLSSPQTSYFEQNPDDWWNSTRKVLREIANLVNPNKIEAISISNQRETFVPLDSWGNALRPAILWLDERCKDEVEPFAGEIGKKRIHQITGKPVDYAPVVYRLAWMKKHEPELYKKIHKICDVHCYLVHKLTGSWQTSRASADPFGLYDMKQKKWSPLILHALKLTDEQLPQPECPGALLGKINSEASKNTGLNAGTLVIAGGGDGQAAGLGSNVLKTGQAYLNLGTAAVAGIYGSQYKVSNAFRTMYSVADKGYYYECSLRAGTFAIDWFIKNILKIDATVNPEIYTQLENEAMQVSAGSDGLLFLPYICGVMNPYWDLNARGVFLGLTSSHKRGHMYRSILEGIAFEQRLAVGCVEKQTGCRIREFIVIGGGAASDFWCQIIADITGENVCIPQNRQASAMGAAIAAAIGAGWFKTFEQAAGEMSTIEKNILPDIRNFAKYNKQYLRYRKIYPDLKKHLLI